MGLGVIGSLAIVVEAIGDLLICIGVAEVIGVKWSTGTVVVLLAWLIFALALWGPHAFSW